MGSIQREDSALYTRRGTASHGNETGTNSSESSERTQAPVHVTGSPCHPESVCGRTSVRFPRTRLRDVMARECRRRRRTLGTGWSRCSNPCTGRDIGHRRFGECISPSPANRRNVLWACPVFRTGLFNAGVAEVLTAIYEQDFLPCSFGGRPRLGAHHALATLP